MRAWITQIALMLLYYFALFGLHSYYIFVCQASILTLYTLLNEGVSNIRMTFVNEEYIYLPSISAVQPMVRIFPTVHADNKSFFVVPNPEQL